MPLTTKWYYRLLQIKSDFQKVFFQNEFDSLRGQSSASTITLTLILFFTLIALSFAVGSIEYLDKRMNNPFTNWVNLPISPDIEDSIPSVRKYFENDLSRDSFSLEGISDYSLFFSAFINYSDQKRYYKNGRTINPTDDIVRKILSSEEENVINGKTISPDSENSFTDKDLSGLIVTQKMLEDLGYENPESQQKILVSIDADSGADTILNVWFDVIAVVKELPNLSDFLSFPVFYNLNQKSFGELGFANFLGEENDFHFLARGANPEKIIDGIKKSLKSQNLEFHSIKERPFNINTKEVYYKYSIILDDLHSWREHNWIFQKIKTDLPVSTKAHIFPKTYVRNRFPELEEPYYLTFNFEDLQYVRSFKDFMKENFKIEISMSQIESKENFFLVSQLTISISVILFIFGTLSIVFFVDSLLKTHLQKIKPNLGTFKAFGLSNRFLVSTYLKIIITFLGKATILAFGTAVITSLLEILIFKTHFFHLFSKWVILALIILFIISILKSRRTISRILTNTPGDLIYNRV